MGTQIKYLISKLQDSFDGSPWYGDSVMEKLNKIDYKTVNSHSLTFSNSVAKLVQHIINWRIYAIKKIEGNQAYKIEVNGVKDWPMVTINSENEWKLLVENLQNSQIELINELASKSDDILDITVPGNEFSYRFLIEGIIQHDIYHLGQIALMAKLESKI